MLVLTERRIKIKFLVKLGKKVQEITEMLRTVYGDTSLRKTYVLKWIKRFKYGRVDATGEQMNLFKKPLIVCIPGPYQSLKNYPNDR